jgi:hypothetical protein
MDSKEAFVLFFFLGLVAFVVVVAILCTLIARYTIHHSFKPPAHFKDFKPPRFTPVSAEYLAATGIFKRRYVLGLVVVIGIFVALYLLVVYDVLPSALFGS